MPSVVHYSLFYNEASPCQSFIIRHQADSRGNLCQCRLRVDRNYVTPITLFRVAVRVLHEMVSEAFYGGTDAQNFIAYESLYLNIRAIHFNGHTGRQPTGKRDKGPFIEMFVEQYCKRLFQIAGANFPCVLSSNDDLINMVANEVNRLHLPRDNISINVAAAADAVRKNLIDQGLTNIEEKWTAYAQFPRDFVTTTRPGCYRGEIALSAVAALQPAVLTELVAGINNLQINL